MRILLQKKKKKKEIKVQELQTLEGGKVFIKDLLKRGIVCARAKNKQQIQMVLS